MISIFDLLLIFLMGSLGGFLSGFLGVGGGIVYVPILDYFLTKYGLQSDNLVKAILANSLFTIIFSGLASSYKQYKSGNFFPKEIIATAWPGLISAVCMTLLIRYGSWYNKEVFNVVFAAMLFAIAFRMITAKNNSYQQAQKNGSTGFNLIGFFAGIITALSGLGGGVVMTPLFTDVLKINIKKASSISNGVIPVFAIAVGVLSLSSQTAPVVSSWQMGYVIFPVVVPMILATFVFAPIGVKASQTTSTQLIRIVFATFVSLVFFKTLYSIICK